MFKTICGWFVLVAAVVIWCVDMYGFASLLAG
jgi:hypothetical protein